MTTVSRPPSIAPFFTDRDFEFEFRCALGDTAHGVGDPGMWLATAASITDGDRGSWFDAWNARGDQLSAMAPTLTDPVAVGWAWRAASAAYSRALSAVDGLPAERADAVLLPTFRRTALLGRLRRRLGRRARPGRDSLRGNHPARLSAAPGRHRHAAADVDHDERQRRVDQRSVGKRRGWRAGPRLERLRLRRPGPAVDAVRARARRSATIGRRSSPRWSTPLSARDDVDADRLVAYGDQPGRLLAAPGARVRAPDRCRRRRSGRGRRCCVLDLQSRRQDADDARHRVTAPTSTATCVTPPWFRGCDAR